MQNLCPPEEYASRGNILFHNGFGIQYAGSGTYQVCIVAELNTENNRKFLNALQQIKIDSACESVTPEDCFGHDFVAVHWTETDKIDNVIGALLGNDITLTYFCKVKPTIKPSDLRGRPWSQTILEECLITFCEQFGWDRIATFVGSSFLKEWNWKTDKGKAFCMHMRSSLNKPLDRRNSKNNYLTWAIFQNCDFKTLLDKAPPSSVPKKTPSPIIIIDDDDDECMICLDAKPDTMVLPCGHCVVCKKCSPELQKTADAKICVKCRCPITHVLY